MSKQFNQHRLVNLRNAYYNVACLYTGQARDYLFSVSSTQRELEQYNLNPLTLTYEKFSLFKDEVASFFIDMGLNHQEFKFVIKSMQGGNITGHIEITPQKERFDSDETFDAFINTLSENAKAFLSKPYDPERLNKYKGALNTACIIASQASPKIA